MRWSPVHFVSSALITSISRSSARPPPGTMPSAKCGLGRADGVFDRFFPVFHFRFRRRPDPDYRYSTCELREPFLQLFLVILRSCLFDLLAKLAAAPLHRGFFSTSFDDRRLILVDHHPLRAPQVFERKVFDFQAASF